MQRLSRSKIKSIFKYKIEVHHSQKIKLTNSVTNSICLALSKINKMIIRLLSSALISNKIHSIKKVAKMLLLANFKPKK